ASWPAEDAGTSAAGTQWAPLHAGLHMGNVLGSRMGGPVYGQVEPPPPSVPASVPASAPPSLLQTRSVMLHAPVGSWVMGFMHGTQSSPWRQVACGSSPFCGLLATSVMHWLRQTPLSIRPAMFAVHGVGTYSLPFLMMGSGTQSPPLQVANASSRPGGMLLVT